MLFRSGCFIRMFYYGKCNNLNQPRFFSHKVYSLNPSLMASVGCASTNTIFMYIVNNRSLSLHQRCSLAGANSTNSCISGHEIAETGLKAFLKKWCMIKRRTNQSQAIPTPTPSMPMAAPATCAVHLAPAAAPSLVLDETEVVVEVVCCTVAVEEVVAGQSSVHGKAEVNG